MSNGCDIMSSGIYGAEVYLHEVEEQNDID